MSNDPHIQLQDLGAYDLTPVEFIEGVFFKRDDLFAPFGDSSVNGGKLRQGAYLIASAKECGYSRILTGCSLISPQAPMIAAAAQYFGMSCRVLYGGTRMELIENRHMPRLALHYGASISIAKSGRANVLLHEARKLQSCGDFIVQYGMNSKDPKHLAAFYESTAAQVQNLPDELDKLIVSVGSGITVSGILYGLQKYNKKVKQVVLVGLAPNREKKIRQRLADLSLHTGVNCWNSKFKYEDIFADGIVYEKRFENVRCGKIEFHGHYEAKTYLWFQENQKLFENQKVCFWIIGAEPTLLKD